MKNKKTKDIEVINLTPHPVKVIQSKNSHKIFPYSGRIARATSAIYTRVPNINGCIVEEICQNVIGLPDPQEGIYYIVSSRTAKAARDLGRNTKDLLVPGGTVTGPDNDGVIGCTKFIIKAQRQETQTQLPIEEISFAEISIGEVEFNIKTSFDVFMFITLIFRTLNNKSGDFELSTNLLADEPKSFYEINVDLSKEWSTYRKIILSIKGKDIELEYKRYKQYEIDTIVKLDEIISQFYPDVFLICDSADNDEY